MRSKIRQLEEQDRELLKLHERNGDLGLEVQNLNEQLEKERTDRKKVEGELSDLKQQHEKLQLENSDLKQKSATASKDLPEAADLLNQLKKAKGKKSSASLADVEAILEMIEKS